MSPRTPCLLAGAAMGALLALPGAAAPASHTVTIEGMQYAPASLTVQRGDTVVWENRDVVPHTASAKGGFESRAIVAGRQWSRVMKKSGRFDYVCAFHPGMKAVVVVR